MVTKPDDSEVREGDVRMFRGVVLERRLREGPSVRWLVRLDGARPPGGWVFFHEELAASTLVSRKEEKIEVGDVVRWNPSKTTIIPTKAICGRLRAVDGEDVWVAWGDHGRSTPPEVCTLSDLTLIKKGRDNG